MMKILDKIDSYMNEARTPIYIKPAQEILKYFQEKGYDKDKQQLYLKTREKGYPEAKKALAMLLQDTSSEKNSERKTDLETDRNVIDSEKSENPATSLNRTHFKDTIKKSTIEDFNLEDFTIRKKKINDSDSDILINGIVIATLSQRKDYVKRKSTDRIRTKMATIRSLHWNSEGLSKLLGKKITAGKSNYVSYDFTDIIGYTSAINNEYIKDEFYRNAKKIEEN